ncbi:lysophospholipase [Uruburuella testudinis]|uniref:Alpha/beta hydrolase n=2 Tax=Pseudomonadota TaxID=1224 RepID=A0A0A3AKY5_9PAST|nr:MULTISPECIES: alpha/beta hydrolase [Pseudomonadota]KGQ70058.1 alpha/beta hydrolase [Chelonobacter oris]UOO81335.1 lysophospholipase [Uruburuella testudinis]
MKNIFASSLLALSLAIAGITPIQTALANPVNTPQIETIKSQDGLNLYLQKDYPQTKPKAVVIIVHGLASHSGVFDDVVKQLNQNRFAVYRFDQHGHGKSEGRDRPINGFSGMVADLDAVIKKAKKENPGTPIYLIGHSMGGHLAALYGTRYPEAVNGYILAAGLLRYNQMNFGHLPRPEDPNSTVSCTQAALQTLNLPTSKPSEGLSLPNDPLMLQDCSVAMINAFDGGLKYLRENSYQFRDPVLLLNGDADLYVLPQDAIDFYGQTNSTDKSLRLYSHIGHLLFLENGGDIVTRDIIDWLNRRTHQ